ncbi:MAG: cysteine synthase A [Oscillospiraceae bacterium]|nr:cysteine synthase A [Oscillospiraceae bacterium]
MVKIYDSAAEIIGNTPILRLCNLGRELSLRGNILAKLEYLNPAGSVKDRVAKSMIEDAESKGLLNPDSVIIEPTSGNTGTGLASVCAARGYRLIIVMPDSMSPERRLLMEAYGASVILTPGQKGMAGAIERAEELKRETRGGIIAGQFTNPANPNAHRSTTGPEIWRDTGGEADFFVAGVGTGGTITGTGEYLKAKKPSLRVIAVEPAGSAVLSGGAAGPHGLQGIGAGFIPETLNAGICDEVITVADRDAIEMARLLGKKEGVLVGISSGAALWAATRIAVRPEAEGKNIVVILPDTGERYLSTPLFER